MQKTLVLCRRRELQIKKEKSGGGGGGKSSEKEFKTRKPGARN